MSLLREQRKLLEQLGKQRRKLDPRELEELKMFEKRHKDEEEFDSLSMKRLRELVAKYEVKRDKSAFDALFKPKQDETN
ncbi:MAG: hypothetical protein LC102_06370 [Ignavibacteriales bacterium]|jgi:hypothetical protein|nr:MAG: hypothetical protein F9K26_08410 [Ignavibacteriaceae bacterium]MBW7873297.1 hypothetical protein [Ignavibacteria bacterium]MCZ2143033.1 hypothetical protein [Ignavibacteriales bacterium]OQY77643.1 MAG: hypothetical protein B6D45_02500 [Ignavibacteriales bacterium UTCHB3]MBV6444724.1 hypothetical protein [Ignavibacteriaceae bacterium]